jgi:hypothetical protein
MAPILEKVVVEKVDVPIVEFANELILKRNGSTEGAGCLRCLSTKTSEKCAKCGRVYSAQQRLNDAIIVATAHTVATIETLWTYDGGVLELGKLASNCKCSNHRARPPSSIRSRTRPSSRPWAERQ